MFSAQQVILCIGLASLSLALGFRTLTSNSDWNNSGSGSVSDNDSFRKKPGTIHITIQCPDGSNTKQVASQQVDDTSIQAVAPFMKYWNELALEAQAELQCEDGQKGLIRLDGFNYLHGVFATLLSMELGRATWVYCSTLVIVGLLGFICAVVKS